MEWGVILIYQKKMFDLQGAQTLKMGAGGFCP